MAALNVIVDPSQHNGNVDLSQAQAAGIFGVIHKATQGTNDPMNRPSRWAPMGCVSIWSGGRRSGTGRPLLGSGKAWATKLVSSRI